MTVAGVIVGAFNRVLFRRQAWRIGRDPKNRPSSDKLRFLEPTADPGLVAGILLAEVVLEKPFFPWDHKHCDEADSWSECYEEPKVIQPN